jgi:hypothetical protein
MYVSDYEINALHRAFFRAGLLVRPGQETRYLTTWISKTVQ